MPPTHQGRPAIKRPAPDPVFPGPELAFIPIPAPNDDLFQEFMRTDIEKVRNQALAAPVAPAAPATKVKDNIHRPLKSRNPDLYYGHLHMECYYFCQPFEDYFEVVGSYDHKHILFTLGFLKDRILNWWQQHKTRM